MRFRFSADRTVGQLARWLRILGFDATYDAKSDPNAPEEGRIGLTRMRSVYERSRKDTCIFIRSDHIFEQVRQVIQTLGITPAGIKPFSRCIPCNRPTVGADKAGIRHLVPDYVWETRTDFRQCLHCGRIYWAGSHAGRTLAIIRGLFEDSPPAAGEEPGNTCD